MEENEFELDTFVRSARKRAGLTLQALSERSGISTSQISKIERGTSFPTRANVISLAKALGVKEESMLIIAGYPTMRIEEIFAEIREKAEFVEKTIQEAKSMEEHLLRAVEGTTIEDWLKFWAVERDGELSKEQVELLASEIADFYTVRKKSLISRA
ncbi:helix-turn-helix domain-containing protein [Paenibacillus sp. FSL M7-0420]|uniref:helix-turn-helix domain-containing protein n=1 Tax=Paenibacillus sp. FSL M7-0420 TaxID=2921609 RepID=UPI0030F5901D